MNTVLSATALAFAVMAAGFAATDADAAGQRVVRANAGGGATANTAITRQGPQGGTRVRNRATSTDGQGNASTAGSNTTTGPRGATAVRSGQASRSADGSAQRAGSFAASGAKGTVNSSGSSSRSADGTVTAERSSNLTGAATGNSVQTNATYNPTTGVTRNTSCYDAAGASMSCPSR